MELPKIENSACKLILHEIRTVLFHISLSIYGVSSGNSVNYF